MTAVRQVYVYLVTFAGLAALSTGIANVVRSLLEVWIGSPAATTPGYLQDQIALWGAMALAGLPVWGLHWSWARRLARDSAERASTLRRLYLYAVLAGAIFAAAIALHEIASGVVMALLGAPAALRRTVVPSTPTLAIAAGVWAYHWRVAAGDRACRGEVGGSAALRRWYIYGSAFVGFVVLLQGAQQIVEFTWLRLATPASTLSLGLTVPGVPDALTGLAIWWPHWAWISRAVGPTSRAQDARSTLRAVYLFLGLTVVVVGSLAGLSQALYYALARGLGVAEPGGVGGGLLEAAAGPLSVAAVYGLGWLYQRAAIAHQAHEVEAPRQIGVRRLYEYLTALVALAVLATGLGGLLWMLGDTATRAPGTVAVDWWRDRVSLFVTLAAVGLPVWLLHWRPRHPADAGSLVRRVYLYLTLTAGVLALLSSGAVAGYRLLTLVLGSSSADLALVELSHALAIALVAAGVSAYHWRSVRSDTHSATGPSGASTPVAAVVELEAPTAALLDAALASLRDQGVTVHRRAA